MRRRSTSAASSESCCSAANVTSLSTLFDPAGKAEVAAGALAAGLYGAFLMRSAGTVSLKPGRPRCVQNPPVEAFCLASVAIDGGGGGAPNAIDIADGGGGGAPINRRGSPCC